MTPERWPDSQFEAAQERARKRTRLSFEIARARNGAVRAALIAALVALVTVWRIDASSAALAVICFVVVGVAEWRGGPFAIGARVGLGGGLLALLVPASVLRPCCAAHAGLAAACDCGMMSSSCWTAGALIGLLIGVLLPRAGRARRVESITGGAVAAASIAAVRCAGLFVGESLGLLGGIIVGVALVGAVSAWLQPKIA